MAKGYTTNADVASLLGRVFTAAENTLCTRLLGAAEEWIDDRGRVSYKGNAQKTEYFYDYPGPLLQLRNTPVVTIDSVALVAALGGTEVAVTPATEYQIRDANKGLVYIGPLNGNKDGTYSAKIVYTAGNTVPERVKLATEFLIAHWMRPALNDEAIGVASFSVGSEENIAYTDLVKQFGVPAEVWDLLGISPGGAFYFA